MPTLQKIEGRTPDKFMVILWNQCDHTITLKRKTTIGYVKESNYIEKSQMDQQENTGEVNEKSHNKLPPMPEKSAFTFHHNFWPKPKIDLEDDKISEETWLKLQILKHDHDDIVSQQSSVIRLTHLEEMTIETDPELPPIMSKPYPLPLKLYKLVKEEIENLLEAGLFERPRSPYAVPIIVVPRKSKPGAPLAETKRLVIDYQELNKQIPRVQMTQAKSKGTLALMKLQR